MIYEHIDHIDTSNDSGEDDFSALLLGKTISKIENMEIVCRNFKPSFGGGKNVCMYFEGLSECLVFNYTKPFGVFTRLDDSEGLDITGKVLSAKVKKYVNDNYELDIAIFHEIITTKGEIMLRYGSESPGYYSCGVHIDRVRIFETEEEYSAYLEKCKELRRLSDERHEKRMMALYLQSERIKDLPTEKDYTSILNQHIQKKYKKSIEIKCVYSRGKYHAPEIKMRVNVNGTDYFAIGSSKKDATKKACKEALKDLRLL